METPEGILLFRAARGPTEVTLIRTVEIPVNKSPANESSVG
jgi:hypothetical protein